MKVTFAIRILAVVISGALPAAAQYYTVNLDGSAGLGTNFLGTRYDQDSSSASSWYRFVTLNSYGTVYDPRLMTYSFGFSHSGSDSAAGVADFQSLGLSYNGHFSFLSGRSFPFQVYFSRSSNDHGGFLIPTVTDHIRRWGVRGGYNNRRIADFNYEFGAVGTETEARGLETSYTNDSRFFSVAARRNLKGWNLQVSDSWQKNRSNFIGNNTTQNILTGSAERRFARDKVLTSFNAGRFSYRSNMTAESNGSVFEHANGLVMWKINDRLDANFNGSFNRNTFNVLQVLSEVASTSPSAVVNHTSAASQGYGFGGGLGYRVTKNLTVGAAVNAARNSLPPELESQTDSGLDAIVGSLGTTFSAGYHRRLWKLQYNGGGRFGRQQFDTRDGQTPVSNTYNFYNSVSGGNERVVNFSFSQSWAKTHVPLFFGLSDNTQNQFAVRFHTRRWRFVSLRGHFSWQMTSHDIRTGHWDGSVKNLGLNAGLPAYKLTFSFTQSFSSTEQLFGLLDLITSSPGTPQPTPLPPRFLSREVISGGNNSQFSVNWNPRTDFGLTGRWGRNAYNFRVEDKTSTDSHHLDLVARYKFGRFTFYGGMSRSNWQTSGSSARQNWNSLFGSVQFPFHLLGRGI